MEFDAHFKEIFEWSFRGLSSFHEECCFSFPMDFQSRFFRFAFEKELRFIMFFFERHLGKMV